METHDRLGTTFDAFNANTLHTFTLIQAISFLTQKLKKKILFKLSQ